jgi:hypothetical protein
MSDPKDQPPAAFGEFSQPQRRSQAMFSRPNRLVQSNRCHLRTDRLLQSMHGRG